MGGIVGGREQKLDMVYGHFSGVFNVNMSRGGGK